MAFITPATGQQITMGRVNKAFHGPFPNGYAPGSAGNAPSGGQNIKLSRTLGYIASLSTGTQIKLSQNLGGKVSPNDYDS